MSRNIFIVIFIFAALCLALAACGESDDGFKEDFEPVNRQVATLDNDMGRALNEARGKTDLQLEKQFGQFAQRAGELQQEVDELEAPDDVKEEQADLTEVLGDVQSSMEDLERAASREDPSSARTAAVKLVDSTVRLKRARRDMASAAGL